VRIEELTGLKRGQTQVRKFLKELGLKWQRVRAIPVPPKKTWRNTSPSRPCFTTRNRSRGSMPMCELLRKIAALGLTGPITLVLDNARYQRNAVVQGLAEQLGITLLFLPSYSPNLTLIERLWRFLKRRSVYGRYPPTFASFQAAIEHTIAGLSTTHADQLASLMTLNFQRFENVSLLAA